MLFGSKNERKVRAFQQSTSNVLEGKNLCAKNLKRRRTALITVVQVEDE